MPRPTSSAPSEPADPWRERLAQVEVQAQATRALAQRTSDDASAVRQRAEAAEARLKMVESELARRLDKLEAVAAERASSPAPAAAAAPSAATAETVPLGEASGTLVERIERVDKLAAQARVALDTIAQDLAEHGRLFSARKARLDSIETRIARAENDPRLTEALRKVESFDLRLASLLPRLEEVAGLIDRVAELEAPRAGAGDEAAGHAAALAALEARIVALESAPAPVPSALDEAALEPLVTRLVERALAERPAPAARGARGAKAKDADELTALKGVGPKLAKSLREHGVTTVAEIAAWSDDDVARMAEKLGTTVAKIKKAGWVEAARASARAAD